MLHIGVDEAGRGPVIGPLVVGCVCIPEGDIQMLVEAGVKDSKDLSKKKRETIRTWFFENCQTRGWKYSVISCQPSRIDIAVANKGLNILETQLFAEAINKLALVGNDNGFMITNDACDVDEKRFTRRISALIDQWPWPNSEMVSFHKADQNYPIVGMASILAKQHRDHCITEIENKVGFPIGSGYPSDKKTVDAVHILIGDKPHEELRWSWSTVKRIWSQKHDIELPDRLISDGNQTTLF